MFVFEQGKALVMGILNLTPDSFSDGGQFNAPEAALRRALEIQAEGAAFLDVGAQSTRPGHSPVPPEEELRRLLPVLALLQGRITIPVSVDTYSPEVAQAALERGAAVVNDVSGRASPAMAEVVRRNAAGWVLMHNAEIPEAQDPVAAVRTGLEALLEQALGLGLQRQQLCLDPGIGFGKSMEGNLRLLAHTASLRLPGVALLVGASRKRVIDFAAGGGTAPGERLGGSVAAHTLAALGGADILRVHDVRETVQAARLAARARTCQQNDGVKELTSAGGACKIEGRSNGEISVTGLELFAYHGCNPEERRDGQTFLLDILLRGDFSSAYAEDQLENTVNYAGVIQLAEAVFAHGEPCNLIEHAAWRTATAILQANPAVDSLQLCVHKPDAPIRRTVADIAFKLELERKDLLP
ncbi:MAG: dihydropteroate synthase [Oscillospiraceae bacterium]|jgi:dihydropteroate synthase|nr:dihydropteroate synthase [Oscillospiraceae bacterium]